MSSPDSASTQEKQRHPSITGGHAKYIAGAAANLLGYQSGEKQKQEAVEEMRAASEQQDGQPMQSSILGTIEKKVGELTGCEGLEKDGQQRIPAGGSEEASGTG